MRRELIEKTRHTFEDGLLWRRKRELHGIRLRFRVGLMRLTQLHDSPTSSVASVCVLSLARVFLHREAATAQKSIPGFAARLRSIAHSIGSRKLADMR